MVRIGIIGVAHMHVDSYILSLRAAGADVVGVWDIDGERGARWASRHEVAHFRTRDELLGQRLDGVVVGSETFHHLDDVRAAASDGVAILCEKPLGVTVEDSAAIVEACRTSGSALMTAFPSRFAPAVRQLRELVVSGDLGRIRAFSGVNQGVMPMRDRSWFADPRLAGGGAIMDHVVHLADAFSWILAAQPLEVYAVANRVVHSEVVTVETSSLVMITYPGDVFASIDCSWNRPLDYPSWGGFALSVVGDDGTVDVEPMRQRLVQFGGGSRYSWVQWGPSNSNLMISEFVDSISDGREPLVTGEDGHSATRVALAALESVQTGLPVAL